MWKPKRATVLLACGALTLAGCAEPESEIEVTINSAQAAEYVSDKKTIEKEQGRLVECTFETPENLLNIEIQAVVTVPETAIEEGEFEYSLPSVEQIEEIFTEGEKLEWVSSDDQEEVWGIASDSASGKVS